MTATLDIPGTAHAYLATGGSAGTGPHGLTDPLSVEDGDAGYIEWRLDAGYIGGVTGYQLFVTFPPTIIPGVLVSVSLVVQAKGTDSRTANLPYWAENGFTDPPAGPTVLIDQRTDGGAFIASGFWVGIRGPESLDYAETVTALQYPPGTEFVTQHMIETGNVTYTAGDGINITETYAGDPGGPTADAEIRYSYVALRVVYEPNLPQRLYPRGDETQAVPAPRVYPQPNTTRVYGQQP